MDPKSVPNSKPNREISKYTWDHYIDWMRKIPRTWHQIKRINENQWRTRVITAYAHIDLLIANKSTGDALRSDLEMACLQFLLTGIGIELLGKVGIDADILKARIVEVMTTTIEDNEDVIGSAVDHNPFAMDHEFKTYDIDQASAMLLRRLQIMFGMGFSIHALIQCAVIYRIHIFDRFMTTSKIASELTRRGDDFTKIVPCVLACTAVWFGTKEDAYLVYRTLNRFIVEAIMTKSDSSQWSALTKEFMDQPYHAWTAAYVAHAVQSVAQSIIYYLDAITYDPPDHTDDLIEECYWFDLRPLDKIMTMGNYPEKADHRFREYVMSRLDKFMEWMHVILAMDNKFGVTEKSLKVIRTAVKTLLKQRTVCAAWPVYNNLIREILYYMWHILHMSSVYINQDDPEDVAVYIRSMSKFSQEIVEIIDNKHIVIEYDGHVKGTHRNHHAALCTYAEMYDKCMTRRNTFEDTHQTYGRHVQQRIMLIMQAYVFTRKDKWHGAEWPDVFHELLKTCTEVVDGSHATTKEEYHTIVPAWHWCHVHVWNYKHASVSKPIRPIGDMHISSRAARDFVKIFNMFHK